MIVLDDKIDKYRQTYMNLNKSYKSILVFHIGVDAGFFSEYNNMILAVLYCLEHKIQFKLYSYDANFKIQKGWSDFFEPFCEEVSESIHSKFNIRYPILYWREILKFRGRKLFQFVKWKLKFSLNSLFLIPYIKRKYKFDLFTYEIFNEMRSHSLECKTFNIPELDINGSLQEACQRLIEITWHFKKTIKDEIEFLIYPLKIPMNYASLHIRGGDKYLESELYSVDKYMNRLNIYFSGMNIFVLTDDYSAIENLLLKYPEYKIYTLCDKGERGYFHSSFCQETPEYRKAHLVKLFASIELISKSEVFIGTYSSNPGMYLGCRMGDKMHGVDKDQWFIM